MPLLPCLSREGHSDWFLVFEDHWGSILDGAETGLFGRQLQAGYQQRDWLQLLSQDH